MPTRGRRFPIYPDKSARQTLACWIGAGRFIWNAKLNERRLWLSLSKLDARQYPDHRHWPEQNAMYAWIAASPETAWLNEIPGTVKRNAATLFVEAVSRKLKGLGGEPRAKGPSGEQSVWLTRDLFAFEREGDKVWLRIGTKAKPLHRIPVNAFREFQQPASVHVKVDGGKWFVSFAFDDGQSYPETAQEIAERLVMAPLEELAAKAWGGDRGVVIPVAGSDGSRVEFSDVQKRRMAEKEARAKCCQRKLARQREGYAKQKAAATAAGQPLPRVSGKQRKALARLRKCQRYAAAVRNDLAHKASRALVEDSRFAIYGLENLRIKNMVKAPKAKPDPAHPGRFLPNGAAAKAGLNKAILGSIWSRFAGFLEYKALAAGKLVVKIDPKHTSQTCPACGLISPDNRLSQAEFVCTGCGLSGNADHIAAGNVAKRAAVAVAAGIVFSKAKKIAARKRPVGAECPEAGASQPMPAEGHMSDTATPLAAVPKKREAPCEAALAAPLAG